MLTRNEAERLAAAIHSLRPEWPAASLLTFLGKNKDRPLLEITVELAWVAQLPETRTPARIAEDGPWKRAIGGREHNTSAHIRRPADDDCATCGRPERRHDYHGAIDDHDFLHPNDHARALAARRNEEATP